MTISKHAAVTLPGLSNLWKKKPIKLRQIGQQAPVQKVAAFKFKMPTFGGTMSSLGNAWRTAGGSGSRSIAEGLGRNLDTLKSSARFKNMSPELQAASYKRIDTPRRNAASDARFMQYGRNSLAGGAGLYAGYGAYNAGAAPASQQQTDQQPTVPPPNSRLAQRQSGMFGGLLDDFMKPESDEDAAARNAQKAALGENITLMQRWQLADPSTRYMILAALAGGGVGIMSALRN